MIILLLGTATKAQTNWVSVDEHFVPLPAGIHVFRSTDSLDKKPFIAYYLKAKLTDYNLYFTADTSSGRRLTPTQFYKKDNYPLVVVNCTFFNFEKNQNLNLIINDGKLLACNTHSIPLKGKDTFQYLHPFGSALGINKKRHADVAWVFTDSVTGKAYALQNAYPAVKDSVRSFSFEYARQSLKPAKAKWKKWKMQTAIGGGPVLVQDGKIKITNEEELKFAGKAINDKHPRTCMGYTKDGHLIIMAIQGRFPGIAEGASLRQEAKLLMELGCVEALNLDGGGSSCLLINGKETIKPSDKEGERPVPAVFIINGK